MSDITGVLLGVGGTLLAALLAWILVSIARQWRSPKRIDRLERMIPPIARALLVLLDVHCVEGTNGEVKETRTELHRILSDQAVSQKAGV
jgi:hypothetical protein